MTAQSTLPYFADDTAAMATVPRYGLYRTSHTDPAAVRMRVKSDVPEYYYVMTNCRTQTNFFTMNATTSWCMEVWAYVTVFDTTDVTYLFDVYSDADYGPTNPGRRSLMLGINTSYKLILNRYYNTAVAALTVQPPLNTWTHFAVQYSNSSVYVYMNGSNVYTGVEPSGANWGTMLNGPVAIGQSSSGIGLVNGKVYYSNARLSTGVVYSSNFSPPFPLTTQSNTRMLVRGNPLSGGP